MENPMKKVNILSLSFIFSKLIFMAILRLFYLLMVSLSIMDVISCLCYRGLIWNSRKVREVEIEGVMGNPLRCENVVNLFD